MQKLAVYVQCVQTVKISISKHTSVRIFPTCNDKSGPVSNEIALRFLNSSSCLVRSPNFVVVSLTPSRYTIDVIPSLWTLVDFHVKEMVLDSVTRTNVYFIDVSQ